MAEMNPATALRKLQQAQAGLKRARQLLRQGPAPERAGAVFAAGWSSLAEAHRLLAGIGVEAADDAVLTRQLAVQRYATALLVRLRRLQRGGGAGGGLQAPGGLDDDALDDGAFEDEEIED